MRNAAAANKFPFPCFFLYPLPPPSAATEFKVPQKYTLLKSLGKGAYGVVVSCKDHSLNTKVAIKKITPMCSSKSDGKHTLRELRLVRWLGKHPNIIALRDIILDVAEDTCYVVMELYDTDLHKIIQSPQPLGDAHLKHFLYQLLRGLRFLHSYNVIHRDLKPANLVRAAGNRRCVVGCTFLFLFSFAAAAEPPSPYILHLNPPPAACHQKLRPLHQRLWACAHDAPGRCSGHGHGHGRCCAKAGDHD